MHVKMYPTSRNFLLGSVQLFIALAGTVGNLVVILAIFWNRTLLRNMHYYMLSYTWQYAIFLFLSLQRPLFIMLSLAVG